MSSNDNSSHNRTHEYHPKTHMVVEQTFRGPPDSGNGGYVAGALAECFDRFGVDRHAQAVEVTLRAPTPLDCELEVHPASDQQSLELMQGATLIAQAALVPLHMQIPPPPTYAQAEAVRAKSPSFYKNINPLLPAGTGFHPICFCCGADVDDESGLHVYAAPVEGFTGVAAAWRPPLTFAEADGYLPERMIWAALDCPGQFAYLVDGIRTGLLGRMTAKMCKPVKADQNLMITGWCIEVERSKHFAGTALFDSQGDVCGFSKQVWIGRRD
jgi:hypothetical protein